jgi:hypothetical protein
MLKRDPKLAAKLAANVKKAKRMNYLMRKYGGKTGEEIANMDAEEKAKKAINEVEGLLPKQKAVADRLKRHELAKNQQKAGNKYGRAVKAAKLAAKRKKTADTEPKLHDIQVHNSTNGVNDQ